MDSDSLQNWIQIIGLLAVVASLIFVGLQLRQAQKTSMSEAYTARAQAGSEWNNAIAANPAVRAALLKMSEGRPGDITADESTAVMISLRGLMLLWDNNFFQYQQGFIIESFWLTSRQQIKHNVQDPFMLEMLQSSLGVTRPEFRDEFSRILDEASTTAKA